MLNLVGKLIGFGGSEDEGDDAPVFKGDPIDIGPPETKKYTAKVTSVGNDYGIIDEEIFFSPDVVSSQIMPKEGESVVVTAQRKHGLGGWRAIRVDDVDDFDEDWDDNIPLSSNNAAEAELLSESPDSLFGVIQEVQAEYGHIHTSAGLVKFMLDECSFELQKGDCVSATKCLDDRSTCIATQVQPLRTKQFSGRVNCLLRDHGYIDQEIYFTPETCIDYYPKRGDSVCGQAIECSRGRHAVQWRAVSVQPVAHKTINKALLNRSNPTLMPGMADLLRDKKGVCLGESSDFGRIELGKSRILDLNIQNTSTEERVLKDMKILSSASCTQFEVETVGLESLPIHLGAHRTVQIRLVCHSRYLGQDSALLVCDFDGFKIGRSIKGEIYEPSLHWLEPNNPFKKSGGYNRYKEDQESEEVWIVPGRKPDRVRANLKLPHSLGQYPVPFKLKSCVMENRALVSVASSLGEELCYENYSQKFRALLHLEEIQAEIEIRDFDMERVCLRPVGEYLALYVPGLAEGRPSLLIGDRVILSEPGIKGHGPSHEGYVHEVMHNDILLKFHQNFHSLYNDEEYNVQFTFNRTTLRRSHQAADFASKLEKSVIFPSSFVPKMSQTKKGKGVYPKPTALVSKAANVVGVRKCPLNRSSKNLWEGHSFFNQMLNVRQKAAVVRILNGQSRPIPYILFGPPGTGKTVTVVESILQIFIHIPSSRIIACTPSNSAADLVAQRLHESGLLTKSDMVRLNAFKRGPETIPESIEPYCSGGDDLELISRQRIIVSTCSSAGMLYALGLKPGHFTHAFVDEAGQATEPECMIPVGLVASGDGQTVLAGDPLQLGPVLRSALAKDRGLELSFLERLTQRTLYERNEDRFADHGCYDPLLVTKLIKNYRSHPAVLELFSSMFYDRELVVSANRSVVDCFCSWEGLPCADFPLIFHGVRGDDLREENSPSWFNPQEVFQVSAYLKQIMENPVHQLSYDDVGIITPYRKQVEKIRFMIDKFGMEKVKVGSVEEFQGQERLVMIISTVRSNEKLIDSDIRHNLGFLSNPKRFNVTISRAQSLMVVIGNPYVLSLDKNWFELLRYSIRNNAYVGCEPPDISSVSETAPTVTPEASSESPPLPELEYLSINNESYTFSKHNLSAVTEQSEDSATDRSTSFRGNMSDISELDCSISTRRPQIGTVDEEMNEFIQGSENKGKVNSVHEGAVDLRDEPVISGGVSTTNIPSMNGDGTNSESGSEEEVSLPASYYSDDDESRDLADVSDIDSSTNRNEDAGKRTQSQHMNIESADESVASCTSGNISIQSDPTDHSPQDSSSADTLEKEESEADESPPVTQSSLSVDEDEQEVSSQQDLERNSGRQSPCRSEVPRLISTPCRAWFLSPEWDIKITDELAEMLKRSREKYEVYKLARRPRERRQKERKGNNVGATDGAQSRRQDGRSNRNDVEAKIIRQLEYYFGDLNLIRDEFLQNEIAQDPDGWVKLSVLVSFKRLQALSTDFNVIADAVKKSTSGLLEVNSDSTKLRRCPRRPIVKDHRQWKRGLVVRSIALSMVAMRENIEVIQTVCEHYGVVEHVEKEIAWIDKSQGNGKIWFLTLIVFTHPASVDKAARYQTVYRRRWKIHTDSSFIDECVGYFYDKRVKNLPRRSLVPVGERNQELPSDPALSAQVILTQSPGPCTSPSQSYSSSEGKEQLTTPSKGRRARTPVHQEIERSFAQFTTKQQNTDGKQQKDHTLPEHSGVQTLSTESVSSTKDPDTGGTTYNTHQPVKHNREYKVNLWMAAQKKSHSTEQTQPTLNPEPVPDRKPDYPVPRGRASIIYANLNSLRGSGVGKGSKENYSSLTDSYRAPEEAGSASYSSFICSDSESLGVSALSSSVFEDSIDGSPVVIDAPRLQLQMSAHAPTDVRHSTPSSVRESLDWKKSKFAELEESLTASYLEQEDDDVIVESSEEEILGS